MAASTSWDVMHCLGVKYYQTTEGGVRRIAPKLCIKAEAKAQASRADKFLLEMGVTNINELKELADGIVTPDDPWSPHRSQFYSGWTPVKRFVKGFNYDRLLITFDDLRGAAEAVVSGELSAGSLRSVFAGKKVMFYIGMSAGARAEEEEDVAARAALKTAAVIILPEQYRRSGSLHASKEPAGLAATMEMCRHRMR